MELNKFIDECIRQIIGAAVETNVRVKYQLIKKIKNVVIEASVSYGDDNKIYVVHYNSDNNLKQKVTITLDEIEVP